MFRLYNLMNNIKGLKVSTARSVYNLQGHILLALPNKGKVHRKKRRRKTDKCQFYPYTSLRTVKTDIFPFFPLVKTNIFPFFLPSAYTYLPKTDICQFFFFFFFYEPFPNLVLRRMRANILQYSFVSNVSRK